MYNIFFIHSSVDGHLGCLHDLAIVNSAVLNIGVHVSFWIMVFSGYMPSILLGHMVILWEGLLLAVRINNSSMVMRTFTGHWQLGFQQEEIKKIERRNDIKIKMQEICPIWQSWWVCRKIFGLTIWLANRERQMSYDIAYMWNLKKWYKWSYLQNRNRVTDVENKFMVTRG